jgi:hypothetical protein
MADGSWWLGGEVIGLVSIQAKCAFSSQFMPSIPLESVRNQTKLDSPGQEIVASQIQPNQR